MCSFGWFVLLFVSSPWMGFMLDVAPMVRTLWSLMTCDWFVVCWAGQIKDNTCSRAVYGAQVC